MHRTRLLVAFMAALMLAAARPAAADFLMLWSSDTFTVPATAALPMAVGDMDGDGVAEIVGKFGTATEVRNAQTGALIKQFPAYSLAGGYAMVDIDNDGTPECLASGESSKTFVIDWVLVTGVADPPAAAKIPSSLDVQPNPSFGGTEIAFSLPSRTDAELRIYDPTGQSVRVLADRPFDAGKQVISWDGRDERGVRLSPGVYFVELRLDNGALSRKAKIILD